ncbi:hypothetical protein BD324DRAFT_652826 [Kockovaella imperatae]|uniref:Wax synthase domain-containing protein n=1 Tax=Kockovaella imperatae TaxID=4999 RepID=A0A1Y1UAT2_9TREE|nr:hypothetical protein BD324DRAFT_652826 [Kockovaella imperatae]ORX35112.1 hypothetical protein BD324DRAFT_652826 [Kockovaella imperatae]
MPQMIPSDWLTSIQPHLERQTPIWVTFLAFSVPYSICYLVHLPNTRLLRMGLWPIGIMAFMWTTLTIRIGLVHSMRVGLTTMMFNIGAGTRWAFSPTPPRYHPLPRQVLWPRLRRSTAFKAFDLLLNESRHVNIAPFSGPLKRFPGRYVPLRRALTHWLFFILNTMVFDLASYPAFLLAPKSFGSPNGVGGDYHQWCETLSKQWGVPAFAVNMFWTLCLFVQETAGFVVVWDAIAFLGIATGVYIPEEWPRLTVNIFRATSLNDLWGKRWHQTNRDFYLLLAKPFAFNRPLHILTIFFISALYHLVTYYPVHHTIYPAWPYLLFYLGQGVCCILERGYYKYTGRKVSGFSGMIWTWATVFVLSRPMVAHEWSSGWAGAMRDSLAKDPNSSPIVQIFHRLGLGPSPEQMKASMI